MLIYAIAPYILICWMVLWFYISNPTSFVTFIAYISDYFDSKEELLLWSKEILIWHGLYSTVVVCLFSLAVLAVSLLIPKWTIIDTTSPTKKKNASDVIVNTWITVCIAVFFWGLSKELLLTVDSRLEDSLTTYNIYMIIIPALVMAPIVEEIVFRKILFNVLHNYIGLFWGMVISAFIFAMAHFTNADFYNGFGHRFIYGLGLAYIFYTTRNIYMSMAFHFIINYTALTMTYLKVF